MIYIKNIIQCKEETLANWGLEYVPLKIILSPQMSFSLIVIYRPPNSNIDFYKKVTNYADKSQY